MKAPHCTWSIRRDVGQDLRIVPGPVEEMQSKAYAFSKHSLGAATVHVWPDGISSSQLGHNSLYAYWHACGKEQKTYFWLKYPVYRDL